MRPIPLAVLTLIHQFEGDHGTFEETRTQDPVGNWEIGFSHKLAGPDDPLWDALLTLEAADDLAMRDCATAAQAICDNLGPAIDTLTDNQYAALIDFTYNEGVHHLQNSTLAAYIRNGNLADVPDEFAKWVYAGGKILNGLVNRRNAERLLWLTP